MPTKILRWMMLLIAVMHGPARGDEPSVKTEETGRLTDGTSVKCFTLRNKNGVTVRVIEYGATVTEVSVPDRNGKFANVVLGSEKLDSYLSGFPAASVIGRFANRIRGAKFMLDGTEVQVAKNSGANHIHGGKKNFSKVVWSGVSSVQNGIAQVALSYVSKDGEEGFPGNLDVRVVYSISDLNALSIEYFAKTDKPTVLNLTNHAYFNLTGAVSDVLDHEMQLNVEQYTEIDSATIPTGVIASVGGTPHDFRKPHRIGDRIESLYGTTRGYDHNYVIVGKAGDLRLAGRVSDPKSGRIMECLTTEPAVQLYTANGFNGTPFPRHGAFCLETQHYPDSPNQPSFPPTVLRPNQSFYSKTEFRFSFN